MVWPPSARVTERVCEVGGVTVGVAVAVDGCTRPGAGVADGWTVGGTGVDVGGGEDEGAGVYGGEGDGAGGGAAMGLGAVVGTGLPVGAEVGLGAATPVVGALGAPHDASMDASTMPPVSRSASLGLFHIVAIFRCLHVIGSHIV